MLNETVWFACTFEMKCSLSDKYHHSDVMQHATKMKSKRQDVMRQKKSGKKIKIRNIDLKFNRPQSFAQIFVLPLCQLNVFLALFLPPVACWYVSLANRPFFSSLLSLSIINYTPSFCVHTLQILLSISFIFFVKFSFSSFFLLNHFRSLISLFIVFVIIVFVSFFKRDSE